MQIFLVYLRTQSMHGSDDYYSYGLGYISSVLKAKGHAVAYYVIKDSETLLTLLNEIKQHQPDIVAFSVTTCHFNGLDNMTRAIKRVSNCFIICGGIQPTLNPESIFKIQGVDALVRGEGEYPMLEFVKALEDKEDYRSIPNFWFKEGNSYVRNELRPLITNLDELPFPDKTSLDFQHAINSWNGRIRYVFSRGCTYSCPYCSNKALADLYGQPYYRFRSPQKAIEEIAIDSERFIFKDIFFDDDTIHLNKKWFYEFFALYKKKFKYPFICNIRPDIIDEEMVKTLKDTGAVRVHIGVEHGNEEFRKKHLKRNMTNQHIINIFRMFYREGIACSAHLIVGLPFENKKIYRDTVRLSRKLSLSTGNGIGIFYPYPATEMGRICEEHGWLPDKKNYIERKEATINFPGFSKKEIQLCHDAFPALLRFKFYPLSFPFTAALAFYKYFYLPNRSHIRKISKRYRMIIFGFKDLFRFIRREGTVKS